MKTILEEANEILQRCDVVVLTSVNSEGFPRPVPLSKISSNGLNEIWFATGKGSVKVRDFSTNNKSGVCFYEQGNSIAMEGITEIVSDIESKKKFWQDWFIEHFPKGVEDENYILLKFIGKNATIWIDGEFVHTKI